MNRIAKNSPDSIYLNGSLVLGQETDQINGGFQEAQSFSGYLTRLQWVIYNFYQNSFRIYRVGHPLTLCCMIKLNLFSIIFYF